MSVVDNDLMAIHFATALGWKSRRQVMSMFEAVGKGLQKRDFFAVEKALAPILPADWDSYTVEKAGRGFEVALEVMKMRLESNK